MCNKNVEVVPVKIVSTGLVEKNLKKHLGTMPEQHKICNLQISAILETAHILRKGLSIKSDYRYT